MTNVEKLKEAVDRSGLKYKMIANWMHISQNTVTDKFKGRSEFTANEIVQLTEILHLSRDERDQIFLQGS